MPIIDFDASTYDKPVSSFEPLPPGDYLAIVASSEAKVTKSGTGEYVEFVLNIMDEPYKGRKIWERLNIHNENKVAEDIARGALNAMSDACGVALLKDTNQLHDIPMTITLALDRKDPTRNSVRGYKKVAGSKPAAVKAASSAGVAKQPWQR